RSAHLPPIWKRHSRKRKTGPRPAGCSEPSKTLSASGAVNSSSDYYYLRDTLKDLLLTRSVQRCDFVLASGRRPSFYVDPRRTTMSGEGLAVIGGLGLGRLAGRGRGPRAGRGGPA